MKITTLIEDTRNLDHFENEMGLSLYIETRGKKILLDTGRTGRFINNSQKLGIDLNGLDACIISHAHYDHGGGLERFFTINKTTPVFMHASSKTGYYASICAKMPLPLAVILHPFIKHAGPFTKYIGLDPVVLDKYKHRISFLSRSEQVLGEVFTITDIEQKHEIPAGNKYLLSMPGDRIEQDRFDHEMILAIREPDGIVLFSGCCHNGILNMIDRVNEYFEGFPVKAVVGGFHLVLQPGKERMSLRPEEIKSLAGQLIERRIENVFTGHCTGKQAYDELKRILGSRLQRLCTGKIFSI